MQRWRIWLAALALAPLLVGCAMQTRALLAQPRAGLAPRVELAAVPFYPQERFQCGPAALAMSLQAAGFAVEPDALTPQVYLPQREGSLQVEMLAAARRHGAFAVTIAPRMDALLDELADGHPVLVLLNLSLPIYPRWHYALAIGYDLERGDIILHSGLQARMAMRMTTFEHTWARSGYWGVMTLAPGELPASSAATTVRDALLAFENSAGPAAARPTWAAAAQRWPEQLTLLLGLGNSAYRAGDLRAALAAFGRIGAQHPDYPAALNNLATVLAELGRLPEARQAAEAALALGGVWQAQASATLEAIGMAEDAQ